MDILLGCGHDKSRRMNSGRKVWKDLCTVDINKDTKPDVEWDINNIPLPFSDDSADEIHAYNVLEHCGIQGDSTFFFRQFNDFWRILKHEGLFFATVPWWNSMWALGDPGHTRVITDGTLSFLDQDAYKDCGTTMRTDYRYIYKGNFKCIYMQVDETETFCFGLVAIKK
ncbi:MAG: hypothetical protein M0R74_11335 [Dehalococcoidia bacterium]|nr:hypothetical protein [Dehalococcoidia bacterium]